MSVFMLQAYRPKKRCRFKTSYTLFCCARKSTNLRNLARAQWKKKTIKNVCSGTHNIRTAEGVILTLFCFCSIFFYLNIFSIQILEPKTFLLLKPWTVIHRKTDGVTLTHNFLAEKKCFLESSMVIHEVSRS